MQKIVQSRVGEDGTCFRASIASLLNLKESQVPDWPDANQDPGVNRWLAKRGLQYDEIPTTNPAPLGYHIGLGTSPRGGCHAVVMKDGALAWDPHPKELHDGQGLVSVKAWGLLLPLGARDEDRYAKIAANYVLVHNAASKEYKTAFAVVGARMWNADNAHLLKSNNEQALADYMRRTKNADACSLLPRPLTVLNSYPDVTPKQRKWLNNEVDKIHSKFQAHLKGVAQDAFIDSSDGSVHPDPKPARQFKAWAEKRQGKDSYAKCYTEAEIQRLSDPGKNGSRAAARIVRDLAEQSYFYWENERRAAKELGFEDDAKKASNQCARFAKLIKRGRVTDAIRPYKAGDKIILPNGKLATVTKCMPAENLLGEKEWHVSTKTGEVLPIPVKKARAKDADEPRCAVCGSNVEEAQGYTRKAWCSECGKVQPMRESRNTWGPTKAQDRSRYHAALDRALDAALFQEPYKGFDLQLEPLASLNGKAVWTARLNGKLRGWRERLPELKTAIAAGDIGA